MTRLALSLLGPFEATLDGEPIDSFRSAKVQALLAYLAVEADRPHRRDTLAALLWPDRSESAARNNLRYTLATLRKTLGDRDSETPFLLITRETIQFNAGSDHCLDVGRFEECARASRPIRRFKGRSRPAARRLEEAATLYRGGFLEGFSLKGCLDFDDWSLLIRERLHNQALAALSWLAQHYERRGEIERATEAARRRVALEPWEEEGHRRLMQLLAIDGQRGAALAQYETCRRILWEELEVDPDRETRALYERIRDGEVVRAAHPRPLNNLPAQLTPFVGREAELESILDRLEDPGCRLLTLVGPGGSGKTRLALEAAAVQLCDFEDGVFFVSLASVRSADGIVPTVTAALGLILRGGLDPRQQILTYLSRKHLLLILDNFEHLLSPSVPRPFGTLRASDGGEGLLIDILRGAPDVTILVTSRAELKAQGGHRFPVGGMSFPGLATEIAGNLSQFSALELFLAGARRVEPGFELATGNLMDVVRICRLVNGMPLGILMAVSWVKILSPSEIADEIARNLDFLETDLAGVPARQRSMRAVFNHSWGLLTEREQQVFQGLSVFRGSFTRRAVQDVTEASLHELAALVDKSLMVHAKAGRFEIHELLRQYGEEKLEASSPARETAHDRHCAYYVAVLSEWHEDVTDTRQLEALAEMDLEIENVRAAWEWAAERLQVERLDRAIEGLGLFYDWRGRWQEGHAAFQSAAEKLSGVIPDDEPTQGPPAGPDGMFADERPVVSNVEGVGVLARILAWQSEYCHGLGRREASIQLARRSLALLEGPELARQDTRLERAGVLRFMSEQARASDFEQARRLGERSVALYESLGDRRGMANALCSLGFHYMDLGAFGEAKPLFERSLALAQELDSRRQIAHSTGALGVLAVQKGRLDEADPLICQCIALAREITDRGIIAWGLVWLGETLCLSGRFARAQSPIEEAVTMYRDMGYIRWLAHSHCFLVRTEIHLGRRRRASALAQKSLALSREAEFEQGIAVSFRLLSCLALANGERGLDATHSSSFSETRKARATVTEARRLAQQSASILRDLRDRHMLAVTLAVLGEAERRLDNLEEARRQLCEALRTSAETGAFLPTMLALPVAALLLTDVGQHERAVELYALASLYPFVGMSRWFEDVFGRHIAAVAAGLPAEVAEAARERGRARDLQETVKELLVELEATHSPRSRLHSGAPGVE